MTFTITIPFWLYGLAIPGWLAFGLVSYFIGGAIYAWYGIDQKAKFSEALLHQWGRFEMMPLCVLLWPLAWYEVGHMLAVRSSKKAQWPARYSR